MRPSFNQPKVVLTLFGTRPETIKLAPVIRALENYAPALHTFNITSAQHTDLLYPFIEFFNLRVDEDLGVMRPQQTASEVCARVLRAFDRTLARLKPHLVLVQGDTTTALAGALAAFQRRIPVAHIEAGLRSGDVLSPFPEETNRRLITQLSTYHFAATPHNRATLISEGVDAQNVFLTGNPVVDSLRAIVKKRGANETLGFLLKQTRHLKRIVLTMHRRESFGAMMQGHFRALRAFVETHADTALIFPVHLNPSVQEAARAHFSDHPRIHLIAPLDYQSFIALLSNAWLILSDSGGVQEEAPTLGKPLLILRERTERPEVLETGVARLVGSSPVKFTAMLEEARRAGSWIESVGAVENPFGQGRSGEAIARIIAAKLNIISATAEERSPEIETTARQTRRKPTSKRATQHA